MFVKKELKLKFLKCLNVSVATGCALSPPQSL